MFVNWKIENGKWSPAAADDTPEWNEALGEFAGYQRTTWGQGEWWVVWEGKGRWIVEFGTGPITCVMITCPGDLVDLQFKLAMTDLAQLVNLDASGDEATELAGVVAAVEESLPNVRAERQRKRAAAREMRARLKRERGE